MNTALNVKSRGLCCGCGCCVGICPVSCISISENEYGEYRPFEITSKCINCQKCMKVCPFAIEGKNEDEISGLLFSENSDIKINKYVGYYLSSYLGFSEAHQETGSSGGLATWLLEKLIKKQLVDKVICVGSTSDENNLFEYKAVSDIDKLRNCSRSAYYPVELSKVIKEIKKSDLKYAVIGMPCFIKALHKACLLDGELLDKIKFTVGLVCGYMPTKKMTQYMIYRLNRKPKNIKRVTFRYKAGNSANNSCTMFEFKNGDKVKTLLHQDGIQGFAQFSRVFQPIACSCCDDIFAECADVVFMDAWLGEYESKIEGHSLVVIRNPLIDEMFKNFSEKKKTIEEINIDKVVESQERKGLIAMKREGINSRACYYHFLGYNVPKKRGDSVKPLRGFSYILEEIFNITARKIMHKKFNRFSNNKSAIIKTTQKIKGLFILKKFIVGFFRFSGRLLEKLKLGG